MKGQVHPNLGYEPPSRRARCHPPFAFDRAAYNEFSWLRDQSSLCWPSLAAQPLAHTG